jgi:hypothetical protein
MASARKEIKDALVTALTNVTGLVAARVYKGRYNITEGSNFPLIYVWQLREETDTQTLTVSRHQLRTLTLAVDYWAKAATSALLEDEFDDKCDTLKSAALASSTLSGKCKDILLTSTEYLYEGDEAEPFGCARLTFTVKYFSTEP